MRRWPAHEVKGRSRAAAADALRAMADQVEHIRVHFDVDVVDFEDFPAADVPHRGGLSFAEAQEVLETLLASPPVVGLVVTAFNPDGDADGVLARRLTAALAESMPGGRSIGMYATRLSEFGP